MYRPPFVLHCWQSHLPAESGSTTTTIIFRATYRLTLCITIISPMITFLMDKEIILYNFFPRCEQRSSTCYYAVSRISDSATLILKKYGECGLEEGDEIFPESRGVSEIATRTSWDIFRGFRSVDRVFISENYFLYAPFLLVKRSLFQGFPYLFQNLLNNTFCAWHIAYNDERL
jgi:hypothetical protein